jgi:hypothetical protein
MTLQTGKKCHDWRRVLIGGVASGAMAASLLTGIGVATAFAEPVESCSGDDCAKAAQQADTRAPGESCTGDDCAKPVAGEAVEAAPPPMSADQVLSIIYTEYAQGDGGGQISKLIDDAMKLRALGFKPSNANVAALTEALNHRPNQVPLVEALKETIAYQRKLKAQMENNATGQQPGYNFGVGQPPPGMGPALPPGVPPDPGNGSGVFVGVG